MKKITRRCSASLPDQDASENTHFCYLPAGHRQMHDDAHLLWEDHTTVEVHTIRMLKAVPDHEHFFIVGTYDTKCSERADCPVTRDEHLRLQREYEEQYADECDFCGHHKDRHTTSLPEEGRRDYCTECDPKTEFHSFDQEPQFVPPGPEAARAALAALLGPNCPPEVLERAMGGLEHALKVLEDTEPTEGKR